MNFFFFKTLKPIKYVRTILKSRRQRKRVQVIFYCTSYTYSIYSWWKIDKLNLVTKHFQCRRLWHVSQSTICWLHNWWCDQTVIWFDFIVQPTKKDGPMRPSSFEGEVYAIVVTDYRHIHRRQIRYVATTVAECYMGTYTWIARQKEHTRNL